MKTGPEMESMILRGAGHRREAELAEFGTAMIDGRLRKGAENAVGHVGRTGNLQEMAPAQIDIT